MRIWIDLSNSPHPLLFAPIARRLEELGHAVSVTARDNAQTVELALERWPQVEVIGGQSPRSRVGKAKLIANRVAALRQWARGVRPDVALSHNSYAQILAAKSLGVPAVTAMDFEHQPANHIAFRFASKILLPEALRELDLRHQGARPSKVRYYPGLKEEIYLGDFEPDERVFSELDIDRGRGDILVVARTPPSRAAYHQFENPLFERALQVATAEPSTRVVVLPRHPEQREALRQLGLVRLIIPDRAIDSRSLLYGADAVIGAGGTMTREAALLGVPTFSVFAGQQPLVDRWLAGRGLLRQLDAPADLRPLRQRSTEPSSLADIRMRGAIIVDLFVVAAMDAALRTPRFART